MEARRSQARRKQRVGPKVIPKLYLPARGEAHYRGVNVAF